MAASRAANFVCSRRRCSACQALASEGTHRHHHASTLALWSAVAASLRIMAAGGVVAVRSYLVT